MSMDLTGITNKNEYYTNHYFATVFEENAGETISAWNAASRESEEVHTPWSLLRRHATQFYAAHDRYIRSSLSMQTLYSIKDLADTYLNSLGYPTAEPLNVAVDDTLSVPVYLEMKKQNGAPLLWVVLMASTETDAGIMESFSFDASDLDETSYGTVYKGTLGTMAGEDLATKILFGQQEPPRFLILIGMNQIALIDRNKWNEKRYLQFELEEIFSRLENTTLQAMSVLLHKESLCPDDGKILLDELDEQSQRNASGVSQDLKYALRESIELLGNEVLYDMRTRLGRDLEATPVDAGQLTIECLRYMYRMLFVLFIEARPELGYAPIKAQSYYTGYSLESLRDIADNIRDDISEVGNGYYLHETLAKLYDLIYNGYPKTEEELEKATGADSLHDMFLVAPLKAHIFDPEYTKMITEAKLRNSCMLRIIELMSLTKSTGRKNSRRGRISYANLGINQMGAVYEALLSYRGFIAEHDLYEVKRAGDSFNELDVGYFVSENELDQYTEDERVRYESGEKKGKLRMYEKGTFIYRLAGREREKSASYYTPEVLTKCLVKYALKELLEGKTADQILDLTICEPAMGSAAFLNEAINQLAEAYISRKEQETGTIISYEDRFNELQKVKMYIADRNVYGIDLNPVAVELAEVSLWLNTIYEGGFVPWFGTQLVNGNSLIGARRQVYSEASLQTSSKGLHWYENAPERVPLGTERKKRRGNAQIYHFLLGDPGMCSYSDKVIKQLEPDNIKKMKDWNKKFTAPYTDSELESLRQLSITVDELWENQIKLRQTVEKETQDALAIFGKEDAGEDSHTTIRQKDLIYSKLYKSEHMKNAGPYARLKFAMDYWCALWFWPIDQAELLPSRSEFFNDLNLILVGTFSTKGNSNMLQYQQLSLFPTEQEEIVSRINELFPGQSEVDIDNLCALFPRLALVRQIAEQNHFMHWELEFADLFAEKGGFDLVIGNPPWIKLTWEERNILSEKQPLIAIRSISSAEADKLRNNVLKDKNDLYEFMNAYINTAATQNFLGGKQNYPALQGIKVNLANCFLPIGFGFAGKSGVVAYIHPDTPYEATNGQNIRKQLYPRLRYHFHFINELKIFADVHHSTVFSANVYCNKSTGSFDAIFNLFAVKAIDDCYELSSSKELVGMKDKYGNWCDFGCPDRVIHISKSDIDLFGKIFDGGASDGTARLPVIHSKQILNIIKAFEKAPHVLAEYENEFCANEMWHETNCTKQGIIKKEVHFPETTYDAILSGSHIGTANPLFKCSKSTCEKLTDFDAVDLTAITNSYRQRINYRPNIPIDKYAEMTAKTSWGTRYIDMYRVIARRMLDLKGAKTVMAAIVPPGIAHLTSIHGWGFKDQQIMVLYAGLLSSNVIDFFIRIEGKDNLYGDNTRSIPLREDRFADDIRIRILRLNCLTEDYKELWHKVWKDDFKNASWLKPDNRLHSSYALLTKELSFESAFRTDYERRQALVEIDVLTAMSIGLTLEQLCVMYRLNFASAIQQEQDTWYDATGRIVFTNNRSLANVGFSRSEWENKNVVRPVAQGTESWDGIMKNAPAGYVFEKIVTDDTIPGGPIERTIQYIAPFDHCDRERDYEITWKNYEERYGN